MQRFKKLQVEASKIGARVHLVRVKVDYTKSHNESAMAGGPQTVSSYDVLKVADLYQPSKNKVTDEVIVLFNWINGGGSYQKAVEWGLSNGLSKSNPHEVFAVGEQFPKLNYELGTTMSIVETTGCSFRSNANACCVSWDDAKRRSGLPWQSIFGRNNDWFAFVIKNFGDS